MPNEALVERFLAVTEGTSFSERVILKFAAALVRQLPACQSNECQSHLFFERPEQDFRVRVRVARAIAARDPQLSFAVWNR